MRQNLTAGLLGVCCTLLALNLWYTVRERQLPSAWGQASNTPTGSVAVATAQGQGGNTTVLYLYDVGSKRLACYTANKGPGLELIGVRQLTYDLNLVDLPSTKGRFTVQDARKAGQKGEEDGKESK